MIKKDLSVCSPTTPRPSEIHIKNLFYWNRCTAKPLSHIKLLLFCQSYYSRSHAFRVSSFSHFSPWYSPFVKRHLISTANIRPATPALLATQLWLTSVSELCGRRRLWKTQHCKCAYKQTFFVSLTAYSTFSSFEAVGRRPVLSPRGARA